MKLILRENTQYILRFDRDEEVMSGLKEFCLQERIKGGYFSGLGACDSVKLALYEFETKKYIEKEFNDELEIDTITGDIAMAGDDLIVHMHGTFSDREYKTYGGHVMNLKVSATCEIMLTTFSTQMNREFDSEICLKLLT